MKFIQQGKIFDYSSYSINKVIDALKAHKESLGREVRILECGAGHGNVTEKIISEINEDDVLVSIEIKKELAEILQRRFSTYEKVSVIKTDVLNYHSDQKFDFILNMIPTNPFQIRLQHLWTHLFKLSNTDAIIISLPYALNPSGWLSKLLKRNDVYQDWRYYMQLRNTDAAKINFSWFNLPPCYIMKVIYKRQLQ